MKLGRLRFATLTACAVLAACETVGELPVDFAVDGAVYISPANADGVLDSVTVPLSVVPLEGIELDRYTVMVEDAEDRTVSTTDGSPADALASDNVGEVVLWDGRDDQGVLVDDGEYSLVVQVWDSRDNTGTSPGLRVVVDNTPPSVELSSPFLILTPNGDSRLDTVTIHQRGSSAEDEWVGTIDGPDGEAVSRRTWTGEAQDFEWDGKTDTGNLAPVGEYGYTLTATDRAGNTGSFHLAGILLESDTRPLSLGVSRRTISPNGDGRAETLTLVPSLPVTQHLRQWSIEIRDGSGAPLRTFGGTGLPTIMTFDGTDDEANLLPDGEYLPVLLASYAGGQAPVTAAPTINIDTEPPQAVIHASSPVFSPDGDGRKDVVDILHETSVEGLWAGTLTTAAGEIIRAPRWEFQAGTFTWDGTDDEGRLMPDGDYFYHVECIDAAQNQLVTVPMRVRIDTRPVPVTIGADVFQFSPNGDGAMDTVSFTLATVIPDGIESWSVAVISDDGIEIGSALQSSGSPPSIADWDGTLADGEGSAQRVPDGRYRAEYRVVYEKGTVGTAQTDPIRVDTGGPVVTLHYEPGLFSPDDDGTNDELLLTIGVTDPTTIIRWETSIYDPADTLFRQWHGAGIPPATIRWDGTSQSGELVQSAFDYRVVVSVTDALLNVGTVSAEVPIDILVIREGNRLRIRIPSIYFVPFTSDYLHLDDIEQAAHNLETLDRLAEILTRYSQYAIRIEGHAVSLLWYDLRRAEEEQRNVLLPLSLDRAQVIRDALIRRGIAPERMTAIGYGGSRPIVPRNDEQNRWKNRRVEFILQQ
jgi:flagellar hook assembly protein FlgD